MCTLRQKRGRRKRTFTSSSEEKYAAQIEPRPESGKRYVQPDRKGAGCTTKPDQGQLTQGEKENL